MLDIRYIADNFPKASESLARRGFDLDPEVVGLYEAQKRLEGDLSYANAASNAISRQMREAYRSGESERDAVAALHRDALDKKKHATAIKEQRDAAANELRLRLLSIPNYPAAHVPEGESDKDNVVVREWYPETGMVDGSLDHQQLGNNLGIIDIETATKITGSRFSILKGKGSRLSRALGAFMLDEHASQGYEEYSVPLMVNQQSMTNTGQLPKFEDDLFKTNLGGRPFYLSPTAEVQLTNMGSNSMLDEADLPKKYTSLSTNFRSEAGSAGRDVRGIFRQHQFDKVELVQVTRPEDSWEALDEVTADAERILQKLKLGYRVVEVCTGDLSFGSSFTNDIEVWLPGQQKFREISSVSNFTDFQSRRMNMRYTRSEDGKKEYPHTLNGSALAIGRTLIAVLEQNQQPDGSVIIPEALRDYTKFDIIE